MIDVQVTTHGGVFTSPGPIVDRSEQDMLEAVGEETVRMVQARLDVVLRNPSGNYRSRIQYEGKQNMGEVTDSRVVYGPWLEGVDSRNRTTRFRGYSTFRLVGQQIDSKATAFLRPQAELLARRLG